MKNHWTQVQKIHAGDLKFDTYQRPLKDSKVQKIIENFDKRLINQPKVSFRDGQYWVFDGQHTIAALIKKHGNKDFKIPCIVFHGLTQQEEAELFALQDGEASPVTRAEKIKALEVAGNLGVLGYTRATEECGFVGGITAFCTAFDCYSTLGEDGYRRMLRLLKATWDGEKWSISRNILTGMTLFLKTYGDDISDKIFVDRLSPVDERHFVRKARGHEGVAASVQYALALVDFYNYKARNRLDGSRLG